LIASLCRPEQDIAYPPLRTWVSQVYVYPIIHFPLFFANRLVLGTTRISVWRLPCFKAAYTFSSVRWFLICFFTRLAPRCHRSSRQRHPGTRQFPAFATDTHIASGA
jgi:hypothetical protein